ncbi:MAG: HAMP domain-containing histidine kinase [Actinobacteria bacterium]|nr:HAMP domain-containing histidine kinase [Actinomycetota bacterium]
MRDRSILDEWSSFFSSVIHDLRSSVAVLAGYGTLLEIRRDELPLEERQQIVQRIRVTAQKMDGLLSALRDLNRSAEEGYLEFVRTDVSEVVKRRVAAADEGTRGLQLVPAQPVELEIHVAMVERIIDNLIENAARFSTSSSAIVVQVKPTNDGGLREVSDEGGSVPEPLKQAIFDPFLKGHEAALTYGAGVGLYLVGRFAALHGGRAWVEDGATGGSLFKVFLPFSPTG